MPSVCCVLFDLNCMLFTPYRLRAVYPFFHQHPGGLSTLIPFSMQGLFIANQMRSKSGKPDDFDISDLLGFPLVGHGNGTPMAALKLCSSCAHINCVNLLYCSSLVLHLQFHLLMWRLLGCECFGMCLSLLRRWRRASHSTVVANGKTCRRPRSSTTPNATSKLSFNFL